MDLISSKNLTPEFLAINPRGLVPVRVHDGVVITESNDILRYADASLGEPGARKFFPFEAGSQEDKALAQEIMETVDGFHFAVRTLTLLSLLFFAPSSIAGGKATELRKLQLDRAVTLGGQDEASGGGQTYAEQLAFWDKAATQPAPAEEMGAAQREVMALFSELEQRLARTASADRERGAVRPRHAIDDGGRRSALHQPLPAARVISTGAISKASLKKMHPMVSAWYARLCARPAFAAEEDTADDGPLSFARWYMRSFGDRPWALLSMIVVPWRWAPRCRWMRSP